MTFKQWISAGVTAAALVGLSGVALAVDYKPFSEVENVCPDCEQSKADVVSLSNGTSLRGTIVAENTDFYVMVRYGEVRAIPRGMVQTIDWADSAKPSGLTEQDQILLSNGHVLSGTIIEDKLEPPFFRIKSSFSDYTYTVAKAEVEKAYKSGSEYTFTVPSEE